MFLVAISYFPVAISYFLSTQYSFLLLWDIRSGDESQPLEGKPYRKAILAQFLKSVKLLQPH